MPWPNQTSAIQVARGSNQGRLRDHNERVVLQTLRVKGALPRAELARQTGLTPQTIGLIVKRLAAESLIYQQQPVKGKVGQPSIPISLDPEGALAIGIKLGRRSTDILLVNFAAKVLNRHTIEYPYPQADHLPALIHDYLEQMNQQLGQRAARVAGVGLAAPFALGGWHRLLGVSAQDADHWNKIDLQAAIQTGSPWPVSFAKDMTAACIAELSFGQGQHVKQFLYLFIDTFVGGGLVLNGQLHSGVHGNAGAMASLPLQTLRFRNASSNQSEVPKQMLQQASLWDLEQLFSQVGLDKAAAYDDRALQPPFLALTSQWLDSAADALAHCIVSGIAITDVDSVVLDGSLSTPVLTQLLRALERALSQYSWEGLWRPKVLPGLVGHDAPALGGALLPLHQQFAPDHEIFLK